MTVISGVNREVYIRATHMFSIHKQFTETRRCLLQVLLQRQEDALLPTPKNTCYRDKTIFVSGVATVTRRRVATSPNKKSCVYRNKMHFVITDR